MKIISIALLSLGLACLIAGCSSVPPVQKGNLQQLEIEGLTVSAYPLATRSEVKHVFKVNLLRRGVLPVKLKAENRNPTNSFVIAKDKILVMNETTLMTNSAGQIAKEMGTWSRGKQLGAAASTTIPAIFLIAAMTPAEGAFVFKPEEENLSGKEFQTRTLGPGQTAEGFIYFHFSKPTESTNSYHLVSEIKDLATGEMIPFDLKLNLNLNNP